VIGVVLQEDSCLFSFSANGFLFCVRVLPAIWVFLVRVGDYNFVAHTQMVYVQGD
jgi:hypothetical protein